MRRASAFALASILAAHATPSVSQSADSTTRLPGDSVRADGSFSFTRDRTVLPDGSVSTTLSRSLTTTATVVVSRSSATLPAPVRTRTRFQVGSGDIFFRTRFVPLIGGICETLSGSCLLSQSAPIGDGCACANGGHGRSGLVTHGSGRAGAILFR